MATSQKKNARIPDLDLLQDDVTIINESSRKIYIYMAIVAIFSFAIGGLIGFVAAWLNYDEANQVLHNAYQTSINSKTAIAMQPQDRKVNLEKELSVRVKMLLAEKTYQYEQEKQALTDENSQYKASIIKLTQQLNQFKEQAADLEKENKELNYQSQIQTTMFVRARELFKQELTLQQLKDNLIVEQNKLLAQTRKLKNTCDLTGWNIESNTCEQYKQSQVQLNAIEDEMYLHDLDLKEIKRLIADIGLN